jgi:hypothetical protein
LGTAVLTRVHGSERESGTLGWVLWLSPGESWKQSKVRSPEFEAAKAGVRDWGFGVRGGKQESDVRAHKGSGKWLMGKAQSKKCCAAT